MFRSKFYYIVSSIIIFFIAFVPTAKADSTDIVVTGNGNASSNQVNVNSSPQTVVQQNNAAVVNTSINITGNTGGNSASMNTGESTSVSSGNEISQINVSNAANTSIINQGCNCNGSSTANSTVSGNGNDSTNTVGYTNSSQTSAVVNNTTRITTTIYQSLSTGNNTANNNSGNTSIHTGNISVLNAVTNNSINSSHFNLSGNSSQDVNVDLSGNGTDSKNKVDVLGNNHTAISVTNNAYISNGFISNVDTGHNSANGNSGLVDIVTGNILASTEINNVGINTSSIDLTVCKQTPSPSDNPKPHDGPGTPGSSTSPSVPGPSVISAGSSSSIGSSGQVGQIGAATGILLPATGSNWLFFALLGNIVMFFLGAYLRLRSGRSPGLKKAI